MTNPNRIFCANARPCSASRCVSASGSPVREQVRVQLVAAIGRAREIADLVGGLERAAHQLAASPDMSRPWQDGMSQD